METTVSAISVAIILGAPLLPISFNFVESPLTRLVFVLFAAYATRVGAIPGLLSFLAVVTLLMERNHEVLTRFPNQKPRLPTPSFGLPIQAPPLLGVKEEHAYEPPQQGDHNEEKYEQVEDIHDHREDLPVPPQGSQATSFYTEKGL